MRFRYSKYNDNLDNVCTVAIQRIEESGAKGNKDEL